MSHRFGLKGGYMKRIEFQALPGLVSANHHEEDG
jgi:hypothetical protein